MKKIVRLTENDLHNIVKESTKRIISEISWLKSDSAAGKSEYLDNSDEILKNIKEIREYLENYIYNDDNSINSYTLGNTNWKGTFTGSGQARKMLTYLEMIENFVLRKQKQRTNLTNLNDDNFKKHHNGMDRTEFSNTIPYDDNANLTNSQQEYVNKKW
jgi:hypothetical protein